MFHVMDGLDWHADRLRGFDNLAPRCFRYLNSFVEPFAPGLMLEIAGGLHAGKSGRRRNRHSRGVVMETPVLIF